MYNKILFISYIFFYLGINVLKAQIIASYLTEHKQTYLAKNLPDQSLPIHEEVYDPFLRSVCLYPAFNNQESKVYPPIIALKSPHHLILTFDDLNPESGHFIAVIKHCNADWTLSKQDGLDVLGNYNEFNISHSEPSFGTSVTYTHYRFKLPNVKISGNYVLTVYVDNTKNENLMFTKRFVVYENKINIQGSRSIFKGGQQSFRLQQISFEISHPNFSIYDADTQLKITILQNYRWDNAIMNLKPSFIHPSSNSISYQLFDNENTFQGGNEYRNFDMRTFKGVGTGVAGSLTHETANEVFLYGDEPFKDFSYDAQRSDRNGIYHIDRIGSEKPDIEADYALVHFTLEAEEPFSKTIYVTGAFNNWELAKENCMTYNRLSKTYRATILLKQGVYDYHYAIKGIIASRYYADETFIDGSYSLTENEYSILVYYKNSNSQADRAIAYYNID